MKQIVIFFVVFLVIFSCKTIEEDKNDNDENLYDSYTEVNIISNVDKDNLKSLKNLLIVLNTTERESKYSVFFIYKPTG